MLAAATVAAAAATAGSSYPLSSLRALTCSLLSLSFFLLQVGISGLLCFILEEDWFVHLHRDAKVPVYTLLGASVCFALLFSLIDVLNYCALQCCTQDQSQPLVNTDAQIYLVVVTSITMGLTFGFIFGIMDVEDEKLSDIKMALMRENRCGRRSRPHAETPR